ncbi:MAG: efflux RND transporter periplasmic adaptor subunit [Verrucomicrobia bacterium]|nr:efflux RND transporter periplasmic adaptor subunit [Verrucomicrobiota bacterium]
MNRSLFLLPFFALALGSLSAKPDPAKVANTVLLDENGVANLGLKTTEVEEQTFEETVFALGRIEPEPLRRGVVTSRIPGRLIELKLQAGDRVAAGDVVARLESRQPGDPPPIIALRAANAGIVTTAEARLGEPIEPDKVIMEITDLTQVLAIARVPEHQTARLSVGTKAHIRVSAVPGETFEGELIRFGTSADRERGTVDAVFRLPTGGSTSLRPGMRAEFSIVLSKREGVMAVPRAALQGDNMDRFVYVKDYELKNAYVKTAVRVGMMNDRFVEVVSGLVPGDQVVTQGAYSLAFAGKGSVSLKAALDAAHGHEHNEDGTEVTAEQKAARGGAAGGHDHAKSEGMSLVTILSLTANALLAAFLVMRRRREPEDAPPGAQAGPLKA